MAQPKVLEGTWEELAAYAPTLVNKRLRLIVLPDEEATGRNVEGNLFHATPEERKQALDAIAEMNRGLPVLPPEAFDRENLYEENW